MDLGFGPFLGIGMGWTETSWNGGSADRQFLGQISLGATMEVVWMGTRAAGIGLRTRIAANRANSRPWIFRPQFQITVQVRPEEF